MRSQEPGPYDYAHPLYFASATDPIVALDCTQYCNRVDNGGYPAQIHIPAQARPAQGDDRHMSVIQADGTEIDFWGVRNPAANWGTAGNTTLSSAAIANCGSYVSGSGVLATGPGGTAGGACNGAGLLRAGELLAGKIGHALFLVVSCANGSQYPAVPGATTDPCTGGVGAPLGARLWYDVPAGTTNANASLSVWEKAILNALHDYGGYVEDDVSGGSGNTGIAFMTESAESAFVFGLPDPFAQLAALGWNATSVRGALGLRYVAADAWRPGGVDWAGHFHYLDPCSARGTC